MSVTPETATCELGYNATRFLQMVSEQGGLAAARKLLWSEQPSDGFTTLWPPHRLDLTVEAHVLKQDYASLFTTPTANERDGDWTLRVARAARRGDIIGREAGLGHGTAGVM